MTTKRVEPEIDSPHYKVRCVSVFILLMLLIVLIYSNTFNVPFIFDDKPNITNNDRLHITNLSPSSLWQTFFAKGGKDVFYRPVPSLSLALNWYVGRDNPFGYHLVNISIHIVTALFLFLATQSLLQTPKIKEKYNRGDIFFISLLGAVLWAVNPIQIQAVTYIVQRMASMAAMFSIVAIYFYLKGRLESLHKTKLYYFSACFISCFLAIMSKQNAVLVIPSLVLIQILFFQSSGSLFKKISVFKKIKGRLLWLSIIGVAAIAIAIAANLQGILKYITFVYEARPFTFAERLLTEPRIVLFYISQIFYPLPERLSIAHDIVLSTSFFTPWTTLPAILVIILLIGVSIYKRKTWPLVSFSILFYFLNHAVESTFIPLELIFEHRNYLPSFFLFLPIAVGLWSLIKAYQSKSCFMFMFLVSFVILVLIGLGNFTYIRNHAWKTEETLWHDAMQKAPNDARPLCIVAIKIAWSKNATPREYDVAMAMFNKALPLNKPRKGLTTSILNNMGGVHYQRGEYQKAINIYKRGLLMDSGLLKMRFDLISSLIMLGNFDEADKQADKLIDNPKNYQKPDYFKLKGFILLWQDRPQEALVFFNKALEMEPDNIAVLLNTGVTLGLLGEYEKAKSFLDKTARRAKEDTRPFYALIENSVRAGDIPSAEKYAEKMFADFSVQSIIRGVDLYTGNYRTAPMAANLIMPILTKTMHRVVGDLEASLSTVWEKGGTPVQ